MRVAGAVATVLHAVSVTGGLHLQHQLAGQGGVAHAVAAAAVLEGRRSRLLRHNHEGCNIRGSQP